MSGRSALAIRVVIVEVADAKLPHSGIKDASWKALVPGWTMIATPANPTRAAAQRRSPTFSLRNIAAIAVTMTGATKPIAVDSATGR